MFDNFLHGDLKRKFPSRLWPDFPRRLLMKSALGRVQLLVVNSSLVPMIHEIHLHDTFMTAAAGLWRRYFREFITRTSWASRFSKIGFLIYPCAACVVLTDPSSLLTLLRRWSSLPLFRQSPPSVQTWTRSSESETAPLMRNELTRIIARYEMLFIHGKIMARRSLGFISSGASSRVFYFKIILCPFLHSIINWSSCF